jgi:bifunctional ADP-heptose synthase (sugar kinase/adenylyltransferase)
MPLTLDRLQEILSQFPRLTIGLVGDLFLDRYLDIEPGVREVSIETDLEAYQVTRIRNYPGALGTVMNNLAALGVGKLVAATVIGDDGHGYDLLNALKAMPVDTSPIVRVADRLTPTYTKPMKQDANGTWRELNRIDVRTRAPLSTDAHEQLVAKVRAMFDRVDGLIVLDQIVEDDWGVVDSRLRRVLAELAAKNPSKFIYVDSRAHLGDFEFGILKGNRSEYLRAAPSTLPEELLAYHRERESTDGLLIQTMQFLADRNRRPMFCTLGEQGIGIAWPLHAKPGLAPGYPVPPPVDIVGAGDAATSGIVASMLVGANELEAATVGNLAASITVQQLGTTGTASPAQVLQRLREVLASRV